MPIDFIRATDELLSRVTLEDLAKATGKPLQSFKQARQSAEKDSHRSPPDGWESAALRLAERQAARFSRLAKALRSGK